MAKNREQHIQMGFRAKMDTHRKITEAARRQGRSVNNLLSLMIKEQVDYYEKEGWEKLSP